MKPVSYVDKNGLTNGATKNDQTIQIFRGIAIIAVVHIHSLSNVAQLVSKNQQYVFNFCRQIFNFAVPVFIFLAGYFASKYDFHSWKDCFGFYKKRLVRLVIPYLFWSCFGVLFFHLFEHLTFKGFLKIFLTGQAAAPFYFFIVLFQLVLLTPVLKICLRNRSFFWAPVVINMLSVLALYAFNATHSGGIRFPYYALPFSMWVGFYYWGMIAHEVPDEKIYTQRFSSLLLAVLTALLFSFAESAAILNWIGKAGFAASQIKISSFVFAFAITGILLWLRKVDFSANILVAIGNYSFGIFLIHIFILQKFVSWGKSFLPNWFVLSILTTIIVLFVSVTVVKLARKVFGEKLSGAILGL